MKKIHTLAAPSMVAVTMALLAAAAIIFTPGRAGAQIYEPEGLNMPGAWDAWTNPPANLALASYTQVTGGRVTKIAAGIPRWQTIFSVKATGGDLVGGTYEWLFTSGPSTNYYQNKWSAVTVIMDSLQAYTKEGATNNSIALENDKWYTMNWEDAGYADTRAIFMVTSAEPATIADVSVPASVTAGNPAPVTVTLGGPSSIEEHFFVRFSTDNWATSSMLEAVMTGTTGTVNLPGQPEGTVVSYYAFSSTRPVITADFDLYSIRLNTNSGANFSYTVGAPPPAITWANLQYPGSGQIAPGGVYDVYGQVFIAGQTGIPGPAPALTAWVGYSTADTDPATWTDWHPAIYSGPAGNNDEFKVDLGTLLSSPGRYYYAMRYKLQDNAYVYGGYSAAGGGFWDGTANVSGVLDVIVGVPETKSISPLVGPNPAIDYFLVTLDEPAAVRLVSPAGSTAIEQQLTRGSHRIDVSRLPRGNWLVVITGHSGRSAEKIVLR